MLPIPASSTPVKTGTEAVGAHFSSVSHNTEHRRDADATQDARTLAALKKRTAILVLIILPAIVLTIWLVISERRTMQNSPVAERAIPATIVTPARVWTSTRMTLTEYELDILQTHDYMSRRYSDGTSGPTSGPVDLCVVFSEDNRKGTHPPEVCLEAAGCHIITRQDRKMVVDGTKLTVRELVTTALGGDDKHYLYFAYFYKCGDTFTPSYYVQQMDIVWNGLTRQNTAGALIRYSTPLDTLADLPAVRARTDELITDTFGYLKRNLNAK